MGRHVADTVYLNGAYLPLAEARISPLDRGFLFGDGVYEVIPVYAGRPFRQAEHLRRLGESLAGIRLENPLDADGWDEVISRLIAASGWQDQAIYLQVTRGADDKRDHPFPAAAAPTVFAMAMPLVTPTAEVREQGVAAITATDIRWHRCDIKSLNLLPNVLLRQQAVDAGVVETILLRDGYLKEGTAANIFVVRDGVLMAPPKGTLMLPGITYDVVLELAAAHGVPVRIREIPEAELRSADEVWMTSSPKEVLAVTTLDGRPVGDGRPGPLGRRMWQWYQEFKNTVMRNG
ncbi:D-amino acid aminotransferase [Azovibrio restrictus]|uniref:D-amino acid aminotransferase n=1 Tax=Azovibrio restrictus TaxID=146938 RepID=UPI0026E9A06E|nr:D-amino acid aminotransferase [Azovibrio restrictus]